MTKTAVGTDEHNEPRFCLTTRKGDPEGDRIEDLLKRRGLPYERDDISSAALNMSGGTALEDTTTGRIYRGLEIVRYLGEGRF